MLKRLNTELKTIASGGFSSYFLIVADVMRYCRDSGIPVGPGRGSVCGSAVAFATGIIDVEPIRWRIPFWRFLNPDRLSMPDIDLDICQRRRPEVIQYLRDKYGADSVVQIMTYGTIQAKRAVNDVLVCMKPNEWISLPTSGNDWVKKQADLVPDGSGADQIHLIEFFKTPKPELDEDGKEKKKPMGNGEYLNSQIDLLVEAGLYRRRYATRYGRLIDKFGEFLVLPEALRRGGKTVVQAREAWWKKNAVEITNWKDGEAISPQDIMTRIEGISKYESIHAAGVVISDGPVSDYIPLMASKKKGEIVGVRTAFDYRRVEELGMLKLDVLGLRNVTMLGDMEKMIQKQYDPEFRFLDIPLDDEPTYKLFRDGDTAGIFQLDGHGITKSLVDIQPSEFFDIVALLALYRPGPMPQIENYAKRKSGDEEVTSYHKDVDHLLESTYGLMVFQEQVMELVQILGDYSVAEADIFRKAIGKKIPELIEKEIGKFCRIAKMRGYNAKMIDEVGEAIATFGRYGFNLGHSTGYSFITYWTAYCKANYPTEFFCAILNNPKGANKKEERQAGLFAILSDAKKHGVQLLPPDINLSGDHFRITDERTVRFGLTHIDGVGLAQVEIIRTERDKDHRIVVKFETQGERWDQDKDKMVPNKVHMRKHELSPSGPFESVVNFLERNPSLPSNATEALIRAGCMDEFFEDEDGPVGILRERLITALCIKELKKQSKKKNPNYPNIFEWFDESEHERDEISPREGMAQELEKIGVHLTLTPQDHYGAVLGLRGARVTGSWEKMRGTVCIGGAINRVKRLKTKHGDEMCHFWVDNSIVDIPKITVFPSIYEKHQSCINIGTVVAITGKCQSDEKFGESITADSLIDCSALVQACKTAVFIVDRPDKIQLKTIMSVTREKMTLRSSLAKVYVAIITEDGRVAMIDPGRLFKCITKQVSTLRDLGIGIVLDRTNKIPYMETKRLQVVDANRGIPIWKDPDVEFALSKIGGKVTAELEIK